MPELGTYGSVRGWPETAIPTAIANTPGSSIARTQALCSHFGVRNTRRHSQNSVDFDFHLLFH